MSSGSCHFDCLFAQNVAYNDSAAGIARDVQCGAAHIKNTVNTGYQGNAIHRETNGSEHHSQHDHTGPRHSCGTDGCKRSGQHDGNHLRKRQRNAIAGGNKHSAHTLIDSGSVHVDGSPERKYKRRNFFSGAQFLGAFHIDRQSPDRRST